VPSSAIAALAAAADALDSDAAVGQRHDIRSYNRLDTNPLDADSFDRRGSAAAAARTQTQTIRCKTPV
jgi:hypothetical protein